LKPWCSSLLSKYLVEDLQFTYAQGAGLWWFLVLDPCLALGWEVKLSDKNRVLQNHDQLIYQRTITFMVQYIRNFGICVQA
jgi:hypothetical protein